LFSLRLTVFFRTEKHLLKIISAAKVQLFLKNDQK